MESPKVVTLPKGFFDKMLAAHENLVKVSRAYFALLENDSVEGVAEAIGATDTALKESEKILEEMHAAQKGGGFRMKCEFQLPLVQDAEPGGTVVYDAVPKDP